ncbi:prolipoprotein diacylglyceryl transferase [Aliikangiella marina]|uniref:Prolipoprotein diacylglyceryl transferase n=1 Tax=Aliikangiella marina TaxID=1712262 RepID=A0A545TC29_9GAMM|nr:prolipoprotein diacylglyceryl transferase [Aliikangiella marina]TQV74777.1 prolipoprotein diacylglyceryl transferase [Aliikangiella marina]
MFPYAYQSSSITIGTYGVMLAIAYLTGRHLYIKRLETVTSKPINTELLIILLLVFGVVGAKIMFVLKNPERASFSDWSSLTSGSGFSSQGALLGAMLVTYLFSHFNKVSLDKLLDSAAIPAVIAYIIARIGCFLAGDDCYGKPSDLPWAMSFPNGIEVTHDTVHPVPLYEIGYSILIWFYLTKLQSKSPKPYFMFMHLMLTWGICRFLVEFVAANPIKLMGMSGSQFGALLMFLMGLSYLAIQQLNSRQKKAG